MHWSTRTAAKAARLAFGNGAISLTAAQSFAEGQGAEGVKERVDRVAQHMPPLRAADALMTTALTVGDFAGADLMQTRFSRAWMLAANLVGALLVGASFKRTELGAATLRGTVVLNADFTDGSLKGIDWDGTGVLGSDALNLLAKTARAFKASRWARDPLPLADVKAIPVVFETLDQATDAASGPAFRVRRVPGD